MDSLVEEAKDLATGLLAAGLVVVHDAESGGQHNNTELTRGQQVADPLLDITHGDVEAWADDTALVDATSQLNNDLARAVVVNQLELANVTVLLHNLQELDDNLGGGADQNLALTALLSVRNRLQGIGQNAHAHHLD